MSGLHVWYQQLFFQENKFDNVTLKIYLILNVKWNESGLRNIVSIVINREAKWPVFALNRVKI